MTWLTWLIFVLAALLEVGGDALIRRGLRGGGVVFILAGIAVLGSYGMVVNILKWDFARLLGLYVAFFALLSVLCSRCIFKEAISISTWAGIGVIMLGGLIIQFGKA